MKSIVLSIFAAGVAGNLEATSLLQTNKESKQLIDKIGPFTLVDVTKEVGDISVAGNIWAADDRSGDLANTRPIFSNGDKWWDGVTRLTWAHPSADATTAEVGSFEKTGGFISLDHHGRVAKVFAIRPSVEESAADADQLPKMVFRKIRRVTEEAWKAAGCGAVSGAITIPRLKDLGAESYCWTVDSNRCKNGCFLYKTTSGYHGFAANKPSKTKSFAIKSLGPFPLAPATLEGGELTVDENQWKLGSDVGPASEGFYLMGYKNARWAYQSPKPPMVGDSSFVKYGGFVAPNSALQYSIFEIDFAAKVPAATLKFGEPIRINRRQWRRAGCDSHGSPITLPSLLNVGAKRYCWSDKKLSSCKDGCFLYDTVAGYQAFPVESFELPQ